MKTVSIGIQNLCAPCGCACKYCLLQSCKKAEGIDYFRGKKFAERFIEFIGYREVYTKYQSVSDRERMACK